MFHCLYVVLVPTYYHNHHITTALYSDSSVASTLLDAIIVIIMGKKSKANRKKATIATSVATSTAAAAAATTATATTAAVAAAVVHTRNKVRVPFPESAFFIKAETFRKKGNHSKAKKIFVQGIENGCVPCLKEYTMNILNHGVTIENKMVAEFFQDNVHLHLVLPLALESAIRGSIDAIQLILGIYCKVRYQEEGYEEEDVCNYGHCYPTTPLMLYWIKHDSKHYATREYRTQTKQTRDEQKEYHGTKCSVCEKQDSETVTLRKCDGCKFYYYCSKECQKIMWQEGQHAGVCRHLGLLNKYHKPFAKKIWKDIAVHHIAPQDIPELQELRHRLGLSRPQEDYQDRPDACRDSAQLIIPRKDGTVQIGSFPRPI